MPAKKTKTTRARSGRSAAASRTVKRASAASRPAPSRSAASAKPGVEPSLSRVARQQEASRGRAIRARGAPVAHQTGSQQTEAMEKRLESLEPGSARFEVLRTAIDFKRSWLELAQRLSEVAQKGAFKEWGYRTFEAYALHELHLRRDTAHKLVRSFDFLATHERRFLDENEEQGRSGQSSEGPPAPLPSYQALDVLAEARNNPYLSERDYRELRDQVFREDPTAAQVRKAVRERAPAPAEKTGEDPAAQVRKCLAVAERLYGMLLELESVPAKVQEALESVVGSLRQMVEE